MPARFHCPVPLVSGEEISLPPGTVRHVQVLRLQPGDAIVLFHGGLILDADGLPVPGADAPACAQGAFEATITRMGRSEVLVQIGARHAALPSSAPVPEVHLAAGMPANDRMDWLVEKATELGVSGIQPLMTARGVLRLKGERATRRQAHWQGVAVAASEQSAGEERRAGRGKENPSKSGFFHRGLCLSYGASFLKQIGACLLNVDEASGLVERGWKPRLR